MITRLCIYHIEDNEADRKLLAIALESHGTPVEIHHAVDGEHAREVLRDAATGRRCRPHLVIVDLNLPKRSGIEVLAEMRADPELASTRVVVLTSSDSPKDAADAQAFGIVEYLRKPMGFDEVIELGGHLLQVAGSSA
jgi:chemotaxis family two-component system response regulator Rcp1